MSNFELNDKVRIKKTSNSEIAGCKGIITAILIKKGETVFGVDIGNNHFKPNSYYFKESDLEKI